MAFSMGDLFNYDGSRRIRNEEEYQAALRLARLHQEIQDAVTQGLFDRQASMTPKDSEKAQEATEDIEQVDSEGIC